MMRGFLTVIVIGATGLWLFARPWQTETSAQRPPPKAAFLFNLSSTLVTESSGIAASTLHSGIYWTHNDSGGKAEIHAFDAKGADRGTFVMENVTARDWEDMASRKLRGVSYIYVGDIGDNLKDQPFVRIYRFREPKIGGPKSITALEKYEVKYPDGPKNCETLLVGPTGDIYLVTKDDFGDSSIYKLKSPKTSGRYDLQKTGSIKLNSGNVYSHMITGGDISTNGKLVAIRTYFSILLFDSDNLDDFSQTTPKSLPVPLERQGEAICFDERNNRLLTTSEGAPCRVSSVTLP